MRGPQECCAVGCEGELLDGTVKELSADGWDVCQIFQEPPSYYRVFAQREMSSATQEREGRSSKFKGVCRDKTRRTRQWRARIGVHGRLTHLGYFASEADAVCAYRAACERFKGVAGAPM